jgi:hypothetical protein
MKITVFWLTASCSWSRQMFQRCASIMRAIVMLEGVRTSETSVYFNETIWRYIPKDCHLHIHRRETLKSHAVFQQYTAYYHNLLLLLVWLHGPFSSALSSLRITDHSFLSCALILHLLTPRAFISASPSSSPSQSRSSTFTSSFWFSIKYHFW